MKVLLVNGSPHERGCTYTGLSEVAGKLEEEGVETELFWIGTGDIPGAEAAAPAGRADAASSRIP